MRLHRLAEYGIRASAVLLILAATRVVAAAPPDVIAVTQAQHEIHRTIIDSANRDLRAAGQDEIRVIDVKDFTRSVLDKKPPPRANLIVTVGTDVTLKVVALNLQMKVLSVAIPRVSFEELERRFASRIPGNGRGGLSAIYLDQPLSRRYELIRQILPQAERVAVALGPTTLTHEDQIRRQAERYRLQVNVAAVAEERELIPALDRLLEQSDVMLGIVDSLVFNRASARNVLLTAYRRRVPLIGISPAYVNNGALAAVHSTPGQIGSQLGETIEDFRNDDTAALPRPQYPKYFTVSTNEQVAEALGIHIDSAERLTRTLTEKQGARP